MAELRRTPHITPLNRTRHQCHVPTHKPTTTTRLRRQYHNHRQQPQHHHRHAQQPNTPSWRGQGSQHRRHGPYAEPAAARQQKKDLLAKLWKVQGKLHSALTLSFNQPLEELTTLLYQASGTIQQAIDGTLEQDTSRSPDRPNPRPPSPASSGTPPALHMASAAILLLAQDTTAGRTVQTQEPWSARGGKDSSDG